MVCSCDFVELCPGPEHTVLERCRLYLPKELWPEFCYCTGGCMILSQLYIRIKSSQSRGHWVQTDSIGSSGANNYHGHCKIRTSPPIQINQPTSLVLTSDSIAPPFCFMGPKVSTFRKLFTSSLGHISTSTPLNSFLPFQTILSHCTAKLASVYYTGFQSRSNVLWVMRVSEISSLGKYPNEKKGIPKCVPLPWPFPSHPCFSSPLRIQSKCQN